MMDEFKEYELQISEDITGNVGAVTPRSEYRVLGELTATIYRKMMKPYRDHIFDVHYQIVMPNVPPQCRGYNSVNTKGVHIVCRRWYDISKGAVLLDVTLKFRARPRLPLFDDDLNKMMWIMGAHEGTE